MDSIIEKSRNIDKDYSDEMIEFYRENQSYFDNFDINSDIETIEEVILIKQKYCEALESKAHYKELTVILRHIFILLTKIKSKSVKYDLYYERALFYEGIVLGRQNKYSLSNRKFKELILIDPIKDTYNNWYQSNKKKFFDKRLSICEDIVMITTFFTVLFGKYIFGRLYFQILIFVFLIFIVTFTYSCFYKKRNTKTND